MMQASWQLTWFPFKAILCGQTRKPCSRMYIITESETCRLTCEEQYQQLGLVLTQRLHYLLLPLAVAGLVLLQVCLL